MRNLKLALLTLTLGGALALAGVVPAQAVTYPTTTALPPIAAWQLTPNGLGPYRLGDSVENLSRKNGIDYKPVVHAALTQAKTEGGIYCPGAVQLPLSREDTTQVGFVWDPAAHVSGRIELPCASKRITSIVAYEARYHPYKRHVVSYSVTRTGGKVPVDLGCALPHTTKIICLHSTIDQVKLAYRGRYIEHAAKHAVMHRQTVVTVYRSVQARANHLTRPTSTIQLYIMDGSVYSMAVTAP